MQKNVKKLFAFICVLAMLLSVIPDSSISASAASKITLNYKSVVMKKGAKLTLKVSGVPAKKKVTWKSTKRTVAVVSSKGIVKAKKNGTTVITAKAAGKKVTCKIIVGTPVSKITVKEPAFSLNVGQSAQIVTSVLPKKATVKTVSYKSSNSKIAAVNNKGVVTAVANGTTKIKVQSNDGNKKTTTVSVTVGNTDGQQLVAPTAAPTEVPDTNPVKSIELNTKEEYVGIGTNITLKATLTPADATITKVTWTSENAQIASVDQNGVVTALTKGDTVITAKSKSGNFTAKCTIHACELAKVQSQEALIAALNTASTNVIIITGEEKVAYTIPSGTYTDKTLIIDSPKAEVSNKGNFAGVIIKQIAPDTYHEYAKGNTIRNQAPNSHIVVEKQGSAILYMENGSGDTAIENNGTIKNMYITDAQSVSVTGSAVEVIPVSINADIQLVTNQNLQISAICKFKITINSGAENTTIEIDKLENKPQILGLGMIQVKVSSTGQLLTVVSTNIQTSGAASKVRFTGVVSDVDDKPVTGAAIYLVPYQEGYDIANIETDSNCIKLVTDDEGKYCAESVTTGNYILVVKETDYMLVKQNIVITTTYGQTYNNEAINLLPKSYEGKFGNVKGVIKEAQNGTTLENMTVFIRNNKNNLVDDALLETKTDSAGQYKFENLPAGYYTVQVVDARTDIERNYMSAYFNILIRPDETTEEGGTLTFPVMDSQMRFVLSWGSRASGAIADADSHLIGPAADGIGLFHTYYIDMDYMSEGVNYADLDVDDTDYEGPETTTIYEKVNGVYRFYVHDFSNKDSKKTDKLSKSDVYVKVYSGSFLLATYHIPSGEGTLWHVCDYNSVTGKLTNINTLEYCTGETSEVGFTQKELNEKQVVSSIAEVKNYINLINEPDNELQKKINSLYEKYVETTDDTEVKAISSEITEMKTELAKELSLNVTVTGNDIEGYNSLEATNKLILQKRLDSESIENEITFTNAKTVEEVQPTDPEATKAYKVTTESGLERIIQVYEQYKIVPNRASVKGTETDNISVNEYDDEDDYNWDGNVYVYGFETKANVNLVNDVKVYAGTLEGVIAEEEDRYGDKYVSVTFSCKNQVKKYHLYYYEGHRPMISDPDNEILASKWRNSDEFIMVGTNATIGDDLVAVVPEGYTTTFEKVSDEDYDYEEYKISVKKEATDSDDSDIDDYYVYYYTPQQYAKRNAIYYCYAYNYQEDEDCDGKRSYDGTVNTKDMTITFEGKELDTPIRLEANNRAVVKMVQNEDYFATLTYTTSELPNYQMQYKVYYNTVIAEDDLYVKSVKINGSKALSFDEDYDDKDNFVLAVCGTGSSITAKDLEVTSSFNTKAEVSTAANGDILVTLKYADCTKQYIVDYQYCPTPKITIPEGKIYNSIYRTDSVRIYVESKSDMENVEIEAPEGYACGEVEKYASYLEVPLVNKETEKTLYYTIDYYVVSEYVSISSINCWYEDDDNYEDDYDYKIDEETSSVKITGSTEKAPNYIRANWGDAKVTFVENQEYIALIKVTSEDIPGYEHVYKVYYEKSTDSQNAATNEEE